MKTALGVLFFGLSQFAYSGRMDDSGYPAGGSGSAALTIGLLHALPMLVVAMTTKSKMLTILTAIGMMVLAVAIGGARYAILDILFVALGTWGALKIQSGTVRPSSTDIWDRSEKLGEVGSNSVPPSDDLPISDIQAEQNYQMRDQISRSAVKGNLMSQKNLTRSFEKARENRAQYSKEVATMLRPKSDESLIALMDNYDAQDRELLAYAELENHNHSMELWDELRKSSEALGRQQTRMLEPEIYAEVDRRGMDTSSREKVRCDKAYARQRLADWRRSLGIVPIEPNDDEVRSLMIKAGLIKGH